MLAGEQRIVEEKLAGMWDKEWIEKKLKQEAEQAAEQHSIKKTKVMETAKLLAGQKRENSNKSKKMKEEKDEIYAGRVQEIKDREWSEEQENWL